MMCATQDWKRFASALAVMAAIGGSSGARAQPPRAIASATPDTSQASEAGDSRARRDGRGRWDYSRFRDGPRRVPEPSGSARERAERLELGSVRAAKRLLHEPPAPRWRDAAPGRVPDSLAWPVEAGRFGRGFGNVRRTRSELRHNGIDIVADEKSLVRSVADGIVAYSDNGIRGFGNCLLIVHPNGWVSVYAHNYRNTVQAGEHVRRGAPIAQVGQTGIARGPHLHFELRVDGQPVDPMPQLDSKGGRRGGREHARTPDGPRDTEIGTVAAARRLMRRPAPSELLASTGARHFRNLLWPVRGGSLHRGFVAGRHRGVDIEADEGTAVRAAADGLVVYAGDGLRGVGNAVVVLHRNGWVTLYGSNRKLHVRSGQRVERGEWIAEVGHSGASQGSHLHFELHDRGTNRDPTPVLVQTPEGALASR